MPIRKSNSNPTEKKKVTYEVIEKCGVIGKSGNNTLELRYVSWNGAEPKYDIRPWYIDKDGTEKSYKGVTLTGEELETLGELIVQMANSD